MATVFKKDGKYLKYNERTTHTGTHREAVWVDDLQQATVFYVPPPLCLPQDVERLEATENRTVLLLMDAKPRVSQPPIMTPGEIDFNIDGRRGIR